MVGQAQRLADLEAQVADLAAKLEHYHSQACVIRSFEDVMGYPVTTASRQAQQARHLHAVRDLDPEPEPELEAGA
jgi:hypothetical protein